MSKSKSSELFQRRLERENDALEVGLDQQEFGRQLHAILVGQHAVLGLPTGLREELGSLRHVLARIVRRGVDGVLPLGGEDLRGNLRADVFEHGELAPLRQSCRF